MPIQRDGSPCTWAIGDIHGEAGQLDRLLAGVQQHMVPGEKLVFLGDYIDRGPDSAGVITRVRKLQAGGWDGPVVTLLGNHEDMLLDVLRAQRGGKLLYGFSMWLQNGGIEALDSFYPDWRNGPVQELEGLPFLTEPDRQFLLGLRLHYEDTHAYYVHAGFQPGLAIARNSRMQRLWIRDDFIRSTYAWDKPVVFGHTPQVCPQQGLWYPGRIDRFEPLNRPEKIGIDTGSCFGGYLTAVRMPDRFFLTS